MDNFCDIKLDYPIEVKSNNGQKVEMTSLRLGRLKAKHLKLLPKGLTKENAKVEGKDLIPIIAGLANITVTEAGELDMVDLEKIAEKFEDITGKPQSQTTTDN
jgi:hypothetical protein